MPITAAAKRFNWRFLSMMLVYGVLMTGCTWLVKTLEPPAAVQVALSLVPTLPIAAAMVVIGLYLVEETDEYVRRRVVIAMLIGIGVVLSASTAIGFLQQRDVIGTVDLLWAFPAWSVTWGLAQMWLTLRDRLPEDAA